MRGHSIPSGISLIRAVFLLSIVPAQIHALTSAQVFNKVGFRRRLNPPPEFSTHRIAYYRSPLRRRTLTSEFDLVGVVRLPRVDILFVSVATQPGPAEAASSLGAKGLVVAATGAGSCGNLEEELAAIAGSGRAVMS